MLRYVLPNVFSPVIVYATTLIGLMIVVGSGLSFLGLGVQPPAADWGAMVADGRVVLRRAPHVTVLPGLVILAVSLAFNFLGDGIRDALDPRTIRR
jgi:peptide/nickel transport system permease protein